MRFVPGWDEQLIEDLARCPSAKPVLSCDPAAYTPPNLLKPNPRITVKRSGYFTPAGEMRTVGVELDIMPEKPVTGAFIAAGFMFSSAKVIQEVPYDPYLYFDQEEVTYSARLYTNGWDVFSPSLILIYHYYNPGKGKSVRPLHWSDTSNWRQFHNRGLARYYHIMGHKPSSHRRTRYLRHGKCPDAGSVFRVLRR